MIRLQSEGLVVQSTIFKINIERSNSTMVCCAVTMEMSFAQCLNCEYRTVSCMYVEVPVFTSGIFI